MNCGGRVTHVDKTNGFGYVNIAYPLNDTNTRDGVTQQNIEKC